MLCCACTWKLFFIFSIRVATCECEKYMCTSLVGCLLMQEKMYCFILKFSINFILLTRLDSQKNKYIRAQLCCFWRVLIYLHLLFFLFGEQFLHRFIFEQGLKNRIKSFFFVSISSIEGKLFFNFLLHIECKKFLKANKLCISVCFFPIFCSFLFTEIFFLKKGASLWKFEFNFHDNEHWLIIIWSFQ